MIQRSSVTIDPQKSKQFMQFITTSAKDKAFWDKVKEGASVKASKKDLDELFEKKS